MARMSKITRIIYLTDEIIGSRQPTGRINRIIKVVANRNVNRVTVFGRAVIVRGNINQDLVNINAADLLVSVAGMLWKNCENSGFFEFFYMAGQGTVGNPQTGSQFIHIHFLMLKESLDQPYANVRTKSFEDRDRLLQTFNI